MSESLSALLYLVASVCFIMALRGLSSPDTARAGNIYGIAGEFAGALRERCGIRHAVSVSRGGQFRRARPPVRE